MKFLSSQLAYVLGQREMRRNLRALISYLVMLGTPEQRQHFVKVFA